MVGLGLGLGCGSAGNTGATANSATATTSTTPPPRGTIRPVVGSLRLAWYWGSTPDATWQAIYEVDPHDPRVQEVLEDAGPGDQVDPGDAGLKLYLEQVRGAGITLTDDDATLFSYSIQNGARQVTVRSDAQHTNNDRYVFMVYVSVPGG